MFLGNTSWMRRIIFAVFAKDATQSSRQLGQSGTALGSATKRKDRPLLGSLAYALPHRVGGIKKLKRRFFGNRQVPSSRTTAN